MLIRPAIAADVPAILALERSSATAAHYSEEQYSQAIRQGLKSSAAGKPASGGETEGQRRLALVIEEDSQVKGFLLGRVLGDEWEIENVVVAEEARNRGLGAGLVGEFVKIAGAQGGQTVYLEVRETNAAACRLYEGRDFVRTGKRKNYYRDPEEDAILYGLRLG